MNNKPKYEKIKEFLIANIENGTYQPDEQIPSEKAIAKEFKVSRETVRKALDKLVFEGYLYRIQGLGTFVSPIKGSSSSPMQEKNKIGVVLPISHEYLSFEILAGIEKAYHNTEYEPFVQFIDSNSAITKLKMKYILSSNPKGYIILPTKELVEDEIFKRLLKKEVPMVFVDKTVNNIRKPLVQSDNYLGAYNLTKELIQNSTVKSTMFFSEEDFSISSVKERYNGMSDACKEHNIPVYSEIVGKNEMDRAIDKCLKYHVDTIFCCNDIVAVSTLTALQVRGLSVPEKVRLYGFDDRPIAQSIFPNLTTVRQPLRNMGEVAAKYLVSIIQGENNSEDFKITLPVELVWRDSTGQKIK